MPTGTTLLKDLLLATAPMSQYQGIKLKDVIHEELGKINSEIPMPYHESGCLFADAGDFLARAAILLSQLATGIARSKHLDAYVEAKTEEMEEDHDFSQLKLLEYLEAKHASVKFVLSCATGTFLLTL